MMQTVVSEMLRTFAETFQVQVFSSFLQLWGKQFSSVSCKKQSDGPNGLRLRLLDDMKPLVPRYGEPGGPGAGGTRLPDAVSPGLPRVAARDDEALLEEGAGREADLRVHPVLLGGLLHRHGAPVPAGGQSVGDGRVRTTSCGTNERTGAGPPGSDQPITRTHTERPPHCDQQQRESLLVRDRRRLPDAAHVFVFDL